jgi:hypothetical protein
MVSIWISSIYMHSLALVAKQLASLCTVLFDPQQSEPVSAGGGTYVGVSRPGVGVNGEPDCT